MSTGKLQVEKSGRQLDIQGVQDMSSGLEMQI
jgi:hypothetical protein